MERLPRLLYKYYIIARQDMSTFSRPELETDRRTKIVKSLSLLKHRDPCRPSTKPTRLFFFFFSQKKTDAIFKTM